MLFFISKLSSINNYWQYKIIFCAYFAYLFLLLEIWATILNKKSVHKDNDEKRTHKVVKLY